MSADVLADAASLLVRAASEAEGPISPGASYPMEDWGGSPRRWTINGDFVALQPTGVARYAREVTVALDALVTERHPLTDGLRLDLVAPRDPGDLGLRSLPVRVVKEYDRPRLPQVWAQLQLPRHAPGGLLSFCNLAPVAVRRQIACIHDMQTRLTPTSYGRLFRLAHHLILPLLGRRAAVITTVSETSRQAIVGLRVAPGSKVALAPNGSDHALRWAPERARLSVASRRPFVLAIGRGMPHKNAALLIRIAKRLDAIGLDLWLAGEIGEEELRRLGAEPGPALRVLGRVSDDDLAAALKAALCFAFPSRSEGFGLPAVEAMALGCPVVASTAPSLPEVCGEAALYAGPDDEEAWVAAIDRLRRDPALRADLIERGRTRAATYAWRATAETYLALMASVDRQDRTGRPRP